MSGASSAMSRAIPVLALVVLAVLALNVLYGLGQGRPGLHNVLLLLTGGLVAATWLAYVRRMAGLRLALLATTAFGLLVIGSQ